MSSIHNNYNNSCKNLGAIFSWHVGISQKGDSSNVPRKSNSVPSLCHGGRMWGGESTYFVYGRVVAQINHRLDGFWVSAAAVESTYISGGEE